MTSFDFGQIAYYNNPDPDKEKVRVNLVSQAITFIDERLQANKPLQVRWAIFYLGKRKAKEGVPVLLKYLDYRYTTCGILEESYPAVRALTQIGASAADAAFDALVAKDQSDLRIRLLTAVVAAVDGPKPAKAKLEKALAGAENDAQRQAEAELGVEKSRGRQGIICPHSDTLLDYRAAARKP